MTPSAITRTQSPCKCKGLQNPQAPQALYRILEAEPILDIPAKEIPILQWIEDAEHLLEDNTLAKCIAERMLYLLEQGEDDTIGILAAIEDAKRQSPRITGAQSTFTMGRPT